MPTYTCEKCARVFKQKSGFDAHMDKKKDCSTTTAIAAIVHTVVAETAAKLVRSTTAAKPDITKETLGSFFEDLHNLLWNKAGLNPERALEHMTFFFAYRMIEQNADPLGLPQECRWSYIASLKNEHVLFEAIKRGVSSFRVNPITKPFFKPHEIQKAEIVFDIVQEISRIPLSILKETDALGDIFEYMLSRGMSTMADEGQYFTNRAICKLAFKKCYEIKKALRRSDGSLCTFADWFVGTGGFPAEFVKGVNDKVPDVNWKVDSKSIFCQDMNGSSVITTLLNLLILTGVPFSGDTIRSANSFADPIIKGTGAPYAGLAVDYCFMNPPYGGDKTKGKEYKFAYSKTTKDEAGIKTKRFFVNPDIQSIGIEDDDKVSAGVQLAMATLSADGGVCAIVLPQGFFFGASKKCVELRKKIAEDYRIHYVVDIASGAFANTGTKTSMMIFQKGVGATEKVSFISLDEKPLVEATLEELRAKHYSLNFKQYLPQSAVEVEGFEMVKLGDVVIADSGDLLSKDMIVKGDYPIIGGGKIVGYHNKSNRTADEIVISRVGNACLTFMSVKYYLTDNALSLVSKDPAKMLIKYLYYYLTENIDTLREQYSGTAQPVISKTRLYDIHIPLPSLERQQQIVEAIDGWAGLAQQEEVALKILEKQMMFQVQEMGRGKERVKLGSIATFTFGYGIKSEDFGESGLPIIKTKNFKDNGVSIISSNPRSNKKYDDKYLIKKGDLLMVVDGACGDSAMWLENENGWLNQHVAKLHIENETTRMYVAFVMKGDMFKEYIQSNVVITTIPHMQRDVAKNFEIPLPPLTEQQTLQSDFDEIRHKHAKIAEYKAKAQAAIQRLIPGAEPKADEAAVEADTIALV
jgi:type I restriction-modification system DNA methylase subunit